MMMTRTLWVASTMVLTFALAGCSTTRFESTWKDPDTVFRALDGETIAAFLISDDEASRRAVEDALARELTGRGGDGVAGYTVLSGEDARDESVAARTLIDAGVDAVITLRLVSEDQQTTTTPGSWHRAPTYRRWGSYWTPSWRTVYEPGHTRTDTVVKVETLIYAMDSQKLIWAGLSRTVNPREADAFVRELASEVDKAIADTGLMR